MNGRVVNDGMGRYVADAAVMKMIEAGQAPKHSKVAVFGLTFKENCPDSRNSKVSDVLKRFNEYGIEPIVVDPWASEQDAMREYGVSLTKLENVSDVDCIVVAVAHDEFRQIALEDLRKFYRAGAGKQKVLIDVKGIYSVDALRKTD